MRALSSESGNLYLDVTSACQSDLNTGVKRVQRGLHGWLFAYEDYKPVYWQSILGSYRLLNARDCEVLEKAQEKKLGGFQLYDVFGTGFLRDLRQRCNDRKNVLPWMTEGKLSDVILVPDLLWDSRGAYFRKLLASPMRKVGIFHDAIGLRRAWKSGVDAFFCAKGVRALATFDLVICISQEAESDLLFYWKKWGIKATQTHVILWPTPFQGEQPKHEANFSSRNILYVARLEEHKNHLRLLEACEQLWESGVSFQLRLIGCNAYPLYTWSVRRKIKDLQAKGRKIDLRSHVSEQELHQAYRESSFTVFPSLLEGFGLPILESLWHGRPVVCGTEGALGEAAEGGGCESINPFATESILSGLKKLLLDEAHYNRRYEEILIRKFRTWADYGQELFSHINKLNPQGH